MVSRPEYSGVVVAGQVRYPFSHGAPDALPVLRPPGPELDGVVYRDLHAKHVGLVVTLDRVTAGPVLAAPPLGAAPGVARHLGRQGRVELAPEEAQHVLGGEHRGRTSARS